MGNRNTKSGHSTNFKLDNWHENVIPRSFLKEKP
jgi:hypothetical protein